ncbi:MAG: efflux RND transporter periplasmic adaptor subunit [Alphaproteobacteria bacterium]
MLKKILTIISLASLTLLSACKQEKEEAQPLIRSVRTQTISNITDYQLREFAGQLTPGDQINLSFEVSGTLEEVDLEVGQNVKKGEVLAQLDPATYELQSESQRANVIGAEASLRQAESDLSRQEQLAAQKLVSQSVLDAAKSAADNASAQLQVAKKQLDIANENLRKTQLVAPYDGVISLVSKKSFAQVGVGEAIATIYREGVLEVDFVVPATIADTIKLDQEVELWVSGQPEKRYKGHISELGRLANQVAAFPVVVQITENLNGLRAGEAVRVELKLPLIDEQAGYIVPLTAITDDVVEKEASVKNAAAYLFVYDEATSSVKKTKVHTIGVRDNNIIISDGLKAGDIVVTAGANSLFDGTKVRLLSDNNQENAQ